MSEEVMELDVRREASRKQVTEEFSLPTLSLDTVANAKDAKPSVERPPMTKKQALAANLQFFACCWALFVAGWGDGSLGPLIPRIQSFYHGFIVGSLMNVPLSDKWGFGKASSDIHSILLECSYAICEQQLMALGSVLQIIGITLMVPALPFPVLAIAYAINAVGGSIQDAQANGIVASLERNSESKMGILHAVYGAGALCSPLVATQFSHKVHWSFHYLTGLGLAVINTAVIVTVFRFRTQDECLVEIGQEVAEHQATEDIADKGKFRQIMSHRTVQALAFYILVYVGVEVTMGGWIVTFIVDERHGGSSSGYISTGFWGGLTFGRVALLWVNEKLGERRAIFLYAVLVIALQFIIWFVPSLIGNGIAIALVGALLGPMYPLAMNHAGRVLPRWLLTASIGWIAGFGQTGSAALPFISGAISNKYGIKSLQPFCVALMGALIVFWAIVPGHRRPD
ncbi:hypothetical protein H0H92_010415 [Tricholoma furcatifolium]|nr:hypothetical protein H0H92_010415 [Tricholoma furcatifolium]